MNQKINIKFSFCIFYKRLRVCMIKKIAIRFQLFIDSDEA